MLTTLAATLTLAPAPWTLVVGGDVMLNGIAASPNPLAALKPIFSKADIAVANLEIPLTTSRTPTVNKTAKDVKERRQFILKADPRHAANLKPLGFDYFSLGNNHAMDYQLPGLKQHIESITKTGAQSSGAGMNRTDAEKMVVIEAPGGLRVGFVSYLAFVGDKAMGKCTPATAAKPGVATLRFGGVIGDKSMEWAVKRIKQCKQKADLVFFCLHWGLERQTLPTSYQVSLGRMLVDAGADGVLGCHPHVLQGSETYNGKPILYSTGNLVSPMPAVSAVYTLGFEGSKLKSLKATPITIAWGGKVSVDKDPAPGRKRVAALDALLKQKYPLRRGQPSAKRGKG